ncbi:Metal-binding trascriptional regulator, contains putative Fe-S cluster and ArsR family DNA binding domain [Geosporobacter subterraneus DSM 17957]|uniref:Metal-binding trascriptional regulator, contains putative Fe-S cluster and ArsR family DNA binding domain n=1 Tax=Geosporobacter subterraneus DSM 17957 TaxID=1121919 RepID=A0A1M6PXH6_9FIRM|nr:(Fe-S)-binding protein [Geosporobacter subterraneus]SHK12591.1 Metal-binding trascriptional regulator, contains putative Fe-S cluster and ArsR family DNA binding domain [Geosporobacter subterraneus DSM 17957]
MFLEEIKMTRIQPCTADAERMKFKAKFSSNVSEVLPYINGSMKTAIYNKAAGTLTFKKEFRMITIYPEKLAVAKVINETDAFEIINLVKDLINNTYENRDHIEPLFEMRANISPIEIYKQLPKLNCKRCGETACMAFASKLISGEQNIKKCLPLYEKAYLDNLEKVEGILQILGYE